MNERLLLTSNGVKGLEKYVTDLVGGKPTNKKVAYIPTVVENPSQNLSANGSKDVLTGMGMEVTDFRLKYQNDPKAFRLALQKRDLITISGGDIWKLKELMGQSGLDRFIHDLMQLGIPVITISAATVIFGSNVKDIAEAHPQAGPSDKKYRFMYPLKLFREPLWVHYHNSHQPIIEKLSARLHQPIRSLKDGQAILIKDGKYQIVEADKSKAVEKSANTFSNDNSSGLSIDEYRRITTLTRRLIEEINDPERSPEGGTKHNLLEKIQSYCLNNNNPKVTTQTEIKEFKEVNEFFRRICASYPKLTEMDRIVVDNQANTYLQRLQLLANRYRIQV